MFCSCRCCRGEEKRSSTGEPDTVLTPLFLVSPFVAPPDIHFSSFFLTNRTGRGRPEKTALAGEGRGDLGESFLFTVQWSGEAQQQQGFKSKWRRRWNTNCRSTVRTAASGSCKLHVTKRRTTVFAISTSGCQCRFAAKKNIFFKLFVGIKAHHKTEFRAAESCRPSGGRY